CARTPDDIIFRKELELLSGRMEAMRLAFIVEQSSARHVWPGLLEQAGFNMANYHQESFQPASEISAVPVPSPLPETGNAAAP
ncbi:hybrid-cluster NAD(P)-dependent oxidoreductase, partial [Brucella melitensis]|nr:hybrid-cluster NAD(P)-dependent oxidoreductase [Brucella melitensis]